MRTKLEEALKNIDEKYIDEALDDIGRKRSVKRALLRATAVAAALVIASVGALTGAVALGSMTAYRVVHKILPEFAEGLTPVHETCEDQGIRMTVEGVKIEGGSAEVLVSLTDLTGDRVDETTDLFDSYTIHSTADGSYGCVAIDYDKKTKTKTFMIYIDQDEPIRGDKLDFSVRSLLTGKADEKYRLPEIKNAIPAVRKTKTVSMVNTRGASLGEKYGGWDFDAWEAYEQSVKLLDPDPDQMFSPTDGVTVTAWGWVDDQLHVQVLYDDISRLDNHGYVYFEGGQTINPDFDISFWDKDHVNSYEEYVFEDIVPQDLTDGSFWGRFVTTPPDGQINGRWNVSIILKES